MILKVEWERMMSGRLYCPYKVGGDSWARVHAAQKKFNESEFWHDRTALDELRKCFAEAPEDMAVSYTHLVVTSLLVPFITSWWAKKFGCPKFPKEGQTFRG